MEVGRSGGIWLFFQYFCKDAEKVCRKLELAERLAGDLFLVLQIDLGVGWKIQIVLFLLEKISRWVGGSAEGSIEGSREGCASCEAFGRAWGFCIVSRYEID